MQDSLASHATKSVSVPSMKTALFFFPIENSEKEKRKSLGNGK